MEGTTPPAPMMSAVLLLIICLVVSKAILKPSISVLSPIILSFIL